MTEPPCIFRAPPRDRYERVVYAASPAYTNPTCLTRRAAGASHPLVLTETGDVRRPLRPSGHGTVHAKLRFGRRASLVSLVSRRLPVARSERRPLVSLHSSKAEHRKSPSGRKGARPRPPPPASGASSASRIRRNPSHLEELETAAQTEVTEIPAELDAGLTEAPRGLPLPKTRITSRWSRRGSAWTPKISGASSCETRPSRDNFESDLNLEREATRLPHRRGGRGGDARRP